MSGPERRYVIGLNKKVDEIDPTLHHEGMANPYRSGTPDHWYSGRRDLWVEFKWVELPARAETMITLIDPKKPALSPLQQHWIERRSAEGRNVWVIAGCAKGGVVFRDLGWQVPMTCAEFASKCQPKFDIADLLVDFCQGSG